MTTEEKTSRGRAAFFIFFCLLSSIFPKSAFTAVARRKIRNLSDIYAPVVVGHPPRNAFVGLVKLESGELRHYNYSTSDPFYIRSADHGLTWDKVKVPSFKCGADRKSPISGEYIRLVTYKKAVYCARSKGGIDGKWTFKKVWPEELVMLKPPIFVAGGKRVIVGCHSRKRIGSGALYSDDDGCTWRRSDLVQAPHHQSGGIHHGKRWNHGAVEPTIVELTDGQLWMIMRTAQDTHYESFSKDKGETWSDAVPSRFCGTITMPTMQRLKDGRLLFLWNNTTPLPEMNNPDGVWEDVFTNRDALHAAVSEDDGRTWIGFRELYLNQDRNRSDFAACATHDMSVHQTELVELPQEKILVSLGQGISRRLLVFDLKWLYEKAHAVDFSKGLDAVTTHQYLEGIKGHCAYNRITGAQLVDDAASEKKVLKLCNPLNEKLVIPNQGVVWNFPAADSGSLRIKVKFPEGSRGGRISLLDRWVNAGDRWSGLYVQYTLSLDGTLSLAEDTVFIPGRWHTLRFEWQNVTGKEKGEASCRVFLDNREIKRTLPLCRKTVNGISYLHIITGDEKDLAGVLFKGFEVKIK